jgi:hypothetical protein
MRVQQLNSAHPPSAVMLWGTGRGAAENPPNRFEKIHLEPDADWNPEDDILPRTQFFKDHSRIVIAHNDSPDNWNGCPR